MAGRVRALAGGLRRAPRPVILWALGSADLLFRLVPEVPWRLADWGLLEVLASLVVGSLLGSGSLGQAAAFALYGYLIYATTPAVFPATVRHVTRSRGFRAVAAAGALGFTLVLIDEPAGTWLVGGAAVCLPGVVAYRQRGALLSAGGYPFALLDALLPFEDLAGDLDEEALTARNPEVWVAFPVVAAAAAGFTAIVVLVLGVLVLAIYLIYPLPELAVLCWVGVRLLDRRRPGWEPDWLPDRRIVEIEERVLEIGAVATRGVKGLFTAGLAAGGLAVAVVYFYVATQILLQSAADPGTVTGLSGSRLAGFAVAAVTVVVVGPYGTWYWLRVLTRIRPFVREWHERMPPAVETPPEASDLPTLARPPGVLVPPMAALLALVAMGRFAPWTDGPPLPPALLAAWALALLATVASAAYAIRRREPQPVGSESLALPAAFAVQLLAPLLSVDLGGDAILLGVLAGRVPLREFVGVLVSPPVALPVLAIAGGFYLFYLPDAIARVDAGIAGPREAAYFLGLAGIGAAWALVDTGLSVAGGWLIALVAVAGAAVSLR